MNAWKKVLALAGIAAAGAIGAKVLHETLKAEPVHAAFPLDVEDTVKHRLIADGGKLLGTFQEFKQIRQRWGIAMPIDAQRELHVRAHDRDAGSFSLSAHLEARRDSIAHITGSGDYDAGRRLLLAYLIATGLEARLVKDGS